MDSLMPTKFIFYKAGLLQNWLQTAVSCWLEYWWGRPSGKLLGSTGASRVLGFSPGRWDRASMEGRVASGWQVHPFLLWGTVGAPWSSQWSGQCGGWVGASQETA